MTETTEKIEKDTIQEELKSEPKLAEEEVSEDKTEEVEINWKDQVLYLKAEMENLRKRFIREKSDVIKNANEDLLRIVLPVLDNLELAVKAVKDPAADAAQELKENKVFQNLVTGVDMTLKHFVQTLEGVGVKPVKADDVEFDPAFHEAVESSEDEARKDNHVSKVLQQGYTLYDRLLRPARVVVNKIKQEKN